MTFSMDPAIFMQKEVEDSMGNLTSHVEPSPQPSSPASPDLEIIEEVNESPM